MNRFFTILGKLFFYLLIGAIGLLPISAWNYLVSDATRKEHEFWDAVQFGADLLLLLAALFTAAASVDQSGK